MKHSGTKLGRFGPGGLIGFSRGTRGPVIEKVGALTEFHGALATLGDASVEMVLGRKCADVSRVSFLMRLGGSSLSEHVVSQHDAEQQRFLGDVLGGGILDLASRRRRQEFRMVDWASAAPRRCGSLLI